MISSFFCLHFFDVMQKFGFQEAFTIQIISQLSTANNILIN
ncbi:hypothetical protein QFZ31_000780 [Neobacillus niacini]|nr:hypothetical protein [Neobacillus niacini]